MKKDNVKLIKLIEQVQKELLNKIEKDPDHVKITTEDSSDLGTVNWQVTSEEEPPTNITNKIRKNNGGEWTKHFISIGIQEYNQQHKTNPNKTIKKRFINMNIIHNGKQKIATIILDNNEIKKPYYKNLVNFIKNANARFNDITIAQMDNLLVKLNSDRIDDILVGDEKDGH